jgi:hypothetical protein
MIKRSSCFIAFDEEDESSNEDDRPNVCSEDEDDYEEILAIQRGFIASGEEDQGQQHDAASSRDDPQTSDKVLDSSAERDDEAELLNVQNGFIASDEEDKNNDGQLEGEEIRHEDERSRHKSEDSGDDFRRRGDVYNSEDGTDDEEELLRLTQRMTITSREKEEGAKIHEGSETRAPIRETTYGNGIAFPIPTTRRMRRMRTMRCLGRSRQASSLPMRTRKCR